MRKKLRTIVVGGRTYRWHRIHEHEPRAAEGPETTCVEVLVVYAADSRRAPLRLRFRERPGWSVGYPAAGVLMRGSGDDLSGGIGVQNGNAEPDDEIGPG